MISESDRRAIHRFKRFLEIAGPVPKPGQGKIYLSDETWRYLHGEDVDPTPVNYRQILMGQDP